MIFTLQRSLGMLSICNCSQRRRKISTIANKALVFASLIVVLVVHQLGLLSSILAPYDGSTTTIIPPDDDDTPLSVPIISGGLGAEKGKSTSLNLNHGPSQPRYQTRASLTTGNTNHHHHRYPVKHSSARFGGGGGYQKRYAQDPFVQQGYKPTGGALPRENADFLGSERMWKYVDNTTCLREGGSASFCYDKNGNFTFILDKDIQKETSLQSISRWNMSDWEHRVPYVILLGAMKVRMKKSVDAYFRCRCLAWVHCIGWKTIMTMMRLADFRTRVAEHQV
jgi:hypothetical protein